MLTRRVEGALVVGLLLVIGAISWGLMLRPVPPEDPSRFDRVPRSLVGWQSVDVEMQQSVTEMLGADYNVQRAYRHPHHYLVFVYIGYYGTERGGTPEHTPDVCYPSQGWAIVESSERRIGGSDGFDLVEFVVEKDGLQRLVHFWYRTALATGITSVGELRLKHFWGRLSRNRGDGALIRLSTAIDGGDVDLARQRLFGMDRAIEDALRNVWQDGEDTHGAPGAPRAL